MKRDRLLCLCRTFGVVNIYAPNGNPIGSDKFAYKLAWLNRLNEKMIAWRNTPIPTLVGGDFNVIP